MKFVKNPASEAEKVFRVSERHPRSVENHCLLTTTETNAIRGEPMIFHLNQ